MRVLSRRQLMHEFAALVPLLLAPVPAMLAQATAGADSSTLLIGDGSRGSEDMFLRQAAQSAPGRVIFVDRRGKGARPQVTDLAVPFLPHAFSFLETPAVSGFCFEKWGRRYAKFDPVKRELVGVFSVPDGIRLFGHGVGVGRQIFASAMDDRSDEGILLVLEENGTISRRIKTGGVYLHDCQWDSNQQGILVLNSRSRVPRNQGEQKASYTSAEGASVLSLIDPVSGELKSRRLLGNRSGGFAHFAQASDGAIVVAGSGYDKKGNVVPLVSCLESSGEIRAFALSVDTRWVGEALSIALDPSGKALLSLPHTNRLVLWNYRSSLSGAASAVAIVSMPEPRGVFWDPGVQRYIVSSATEKTLKFLGQSGDLHEKLARGGSGSHIASLNLSKMP